MLAVDLSRGCYQPAIARAARQRRLEQAPRPPAGARSTRREVRRIYDETLRALAEEPPLTLADVEAMSDAECREHLPLMLKVLRRRCRPSFG